MDEKRRTKRWNIYKDARFRLEGGTKFLNCMVDDVSFWGIKISCIEKLECDAIIEMHIDIPDALNPIIVKAKIIWHIPRVRMYNSYGLTYLDVSEKDRDKIYRYLYQNYPHEFKRLAVKGGERKMEDRRVFARIPTNFTTRYLDVRNNKEGKAQVCDICANGIGIATEVRLKPETPLELWLEIPDQGRPLYTRGAVVWSKLSKPKEYHAGIALEKADLMGLSRLFRI